MVFIIPLSVFVAALHAPRLTSDNGILSVAGNVPPEVMVRGLLHLAFYTATAKQFLAKQLLNFVVNTPNPLSELLNFWPFGMPPTFWASNWVVAVHK